MRRPERVSIAVSVLVVDVTTQVNRPGQLRCRFAVQVGSSVAVLSAAGANVLTTIGSTGRLAGDDVGRNAAPQTCES